MVIAKTGFTLFQKPSEINPKKLEDFFFEKIPVSKNCNSCGAKYQTKIEINCSYCFSEREFKNPTLTIGQTHKTEK